MLYWLPRLSVALLVALLVTLGSMPVTSSHVAGIILVVMLGLLLLSLTLAIFRFASRDFGNR